MLSGDAAVAAKLIDGVASLEDVTGYVLALPSAGETTMEDDAPEDGGEGAEAPASPAECANCKQMNAAGSKFCNGCGTSMQAAEDDEPAPDSEEGPPSSVPASKPMPGKGASASLASILGVREGASEVAMRTAAMSAQRVVAYAAKLTGKSDHGEIIGGLEAIAKDAGEVGRLRTERNEAQRKANAAERMSLLDKLEAANIHTRGELFVDVIEGERIVGRKPAPLWSSGPQGRSLENLRGYVALKLANAAPVAKGTPYEPDKERTEKVAKGEATKAQIEAAKKHPAVLAAANRPGAKSIDDLAAAHVAAFGGVQ
jgi:hypothetical protein